MIAPLCRLLVALSVLTPALALAQPSMPVSLDIQKPQREFKLGPFAAGVTPTVAAYLYDGARPYTNISGGGWTGYIFYAVSASQGVYVASSVTISNAIVFPFRADQTATVGTFNCQIVVGVTSQILEWGRGTIRLRESPGTTSASNLALTTVFNWDLFSFIGTPPAFPTYFTNPLAGDVTGDPANAQIAAGAVGSNELATAITERLNDESAANAAAATANAALPKAGGVLTGPVTGTTFHARHFGSRAGTGSQNLPYHIAVGYEAGYGITGDYWSAFGYQAGYGASGTGWSALGGSSGKGARGIEWTAVGPSAENARGDTWAALGKDAGFGSIGDSWLALGYGAGIGGSAHEWAAIGYWAGYGTKEDYALYIDNDHTQSRAASDNFIVLRGVHNEGFIGRPDGLLTLRGANIALSSGVRLGLATALAGTTTAANATTGALEVRPSSLRDYNAAGATNRSSWADTFPLFSTYQMNLSNQVRFLSGSAPTGRTASGVAFERRYDATNTYEYVPGYGWDRRPLVSW